LRDRVRGHTDTDRWQVGGYDRRNCKQSPQLFLQYQRQRSGPELLGKTISGLSPIRNQGARHFQRGDVHDEWTGRWSTFNGVDARDRFSVERIRSETVNRFRGENNKPAGTQQSGSAVDFRAILDSFHKQL
jgi:hypothetical protein